MFDLIEDIEMFLEEYALAVVLVVVNLVGVVVYNLTKQKGNKNVFMGKKC